MDIRRFFPSVNKGHHLANLRVQNYFDVEKSASEAAKKTSRQAIMDKQREARILADRKRRKLAKDALDPKDNRSNNGGMSD